MGIYLYHPEYFSRARRVQAQVDPINERLHVEQCSMDPDEWQRLYKKVSQVEAKVERGTYMQWSALLQRVTGVHYPEEHFKKFTFREMRQIRDRLRKLLQDPYWSWNAFLSENTGVVRQWPTYECWKNTLAWALGIFTKGLKDSKQVYLA